MVKKKLTLTIIAAALAAAAGAAMAQELVLYVDKAGKFSIRYPSEWAKVVNKDKVNLMVKSQDGTAIVQVLVQNLTGVLAMDYLVEFEKQMNYTNLIPEDQRQTPPKQLEAAGGTDGALGAYRVEGEGPGYPVIQGVSVMAKGNKIYVLIQTMQEAQKKVHGKAVSEIAKSFRILK